MTLVPQKPVFLTLLFLICFSLFSVSSYSQINESIRDAANDHNDNSGNNSGDNNNNNSGSTTSDDDDDDDDYSSYDDDDGDGSGGGGCIDVSSCFTGVCPAMLSIFPAIVEYQGDQLDTKFEVPRVVSIDVMLQGGYNFGDNYLMTNPRIRGNWGLFSTDFRIFSNVELKKNAVDTWRTYDWQFIQFNVVNVQPFTLRLGQGITWEQYSGKGFHESSLGMDFYLFKEKLFLRSEGRVAFDWETGNTVTQRSELGFAANYKIMNSRHLSIFATAGALYQRYYQAVSISTLQTGLHFSIR